MSEFYSFVNDPPPPTPLLFLAALSPQQLELEPRASLLSVHVASVLQEQVVLDEGGQVKFGDHPVHSALQEGPESAARKVLQGAGGQRQGEDGLIEVLVPLIGKDHKLNQAD